jgi:hypothetical protein
MNETTNGILLGGLMGFFGGLITIPIHAMVNYLLKRDELEYSRKLEIIAKQRELLLQHKLEMERRGKDNLIEQIAKRLEDRRNFSDGETYLILIFAILDCQLFLGRHSHRNRLRTHFMFGIGQENCTLPDISEIDKEVSETDAGKDLLILSKHPFNNLDHGKSDNQPEKA